jgi:DNA polymerase-3 subunit gamma/tau
VTGAIASQALEAYVVAIADEKVDEALTQLALIFADGKNMVRFTEDLLSYFRELLLAETLSVNVSKTQIFAWIDIAMEALQTLKQTTQEKLVADVMTMRLSEAVKTVDYSQVISELQKQVTELTKKLESGVFQTSQVVPSPLPEKTSVSKTSTRYFSKDFVFNVLAEATNEARLAIQNAWEEVINAFDSGFGKSMLTHTAAVAASEKFVVVTFESEFTAKKASQNQDLQMSFGNFMSNIVGFAPQIIALTDKDWVTIRTEYAQLHKKTTSETVKSQEAVVSKVSDENAIVDQAQALFGDVVEIIDD